MVLHELVTAYVSSKEYRDLSEKTKTEYRRYLSHWAGSIGTFDVRHDITKVIVYSVLREFDEKPAAYNMMVAVLSKVMSFGISRGLLDINPCNGIRKLPVGEHRAWTEMEIRVAKSCLTGSTWKAFMLLLHTGQRFGDIANLRWNNINWSEDKESCIIEVIQEKTRANALIPAGDELKKFLRSILESEPPLYDTSLVCTPTNSSWFHYRNGLYAELRKDIDACGIEATIHGLRKTFLSRLAEAGCTDRQIMAISGHKSVAMVSKYTKFADQRVMATEAIRRLEKHEGQG